MKILRIKNEIPQQNKKQESVIIEYPHLTKLELYVHDDYIELFLLDTKIFLRNQVYLAGVSEERLKRITHNFQRKDTKINYSKIIFARYCGFSFAYS